MTSANIKAKTVKMEVFVHAQRSEYDQNLVYWSVYQSDMSAHDGFGACVAKLMVPFNIPPEFNLTAAEIAALRAQKAKLVENHGNAIRELNEKLAKLEALE